MSDAYAICAHLRFSFPDGTPVFQDLSFTDGGGRIALTGPKGAGRSTLLRLLHGDPEPGEGGLVRRADDRVAHLSQRLDGPDADRTVTGNLARFAPAAPEAEPMNPLARFSFRGSRAHLPVGVLSAGERLRAAPARSLCAEPAPHLLLDEPTDDLELVSQDERCIERIGAGRRPPPPEGRLRDTGAAPA